MSRPSKRALPRITIGSTVLALACSALAAASVASAAAPGPARPRTPAVTTLPVTFQVVNVNRSALACASDGTRYEVRGHLVGPAAKLRPGAPGGSAPVTLYLHSFSFGEFFWHFTAVPRYDYAAAIARKGHVSIVVDRLGYGASGHPSGRGTCLGAAADVAHQVIGELRSGDYAVEGRRAPRFGKVALAGHSIGGLIANLEAYSFGDVDALLAVSYTPQVRPLALEHFYAGQVVCEAGGEPVQPGGPGAYAYFGQTEADFRANVFHRADAAVVDAATRLRGRDPCGESRSVIDALVLELTALPRVKAPVLLVCGREDALTPAFACPYLKRRYTGSRDVSVALVRNAGHALPLERAAPAFRRRVSAWLRGHGF